PAGAAAPAAPASSATVASATVPSATASSVPASGATARSAAAPGAAAPSAAAPGAAAPGATAPGASGAAWPRPPASAHPRASAQPSAPPPRPTPAALERMGEEIAALAAHLSAATYELLRRLAEFDRLEGWAAGPGFRSCAHGLSGRTGIAPGAAREKVRVARALAELPQVSAAMRRGELSYAKVRALTRVA